MLPFMLYFRNQTAPKWLATCGLWLMVQHLCLVVSTIRGGDEIWTVPIWVSVRQCWAEAEPCDSNTQNA